MKINKFGIPVASALVLLLVCVTVWFRNIPDKKVYIAVKSGESAKVLSNDLKKNNIISSSMFFRAVLKAEGREKALKTGVYLLSPKYSVFRIINILVSGKSTRVKVTIPEGFDASQIAERLEENHVIEKKVFMETVSNSKLEGFLFPETYFFELNCGTHAVIGPMLGEFNVRFNDTLKARANELKKSEREIISLASIIEKEAVLKEEKSHIAGVFYNRLKKGWYLESCATVLYAIGKHKENLTYKDLKTDSPYNTYKHIGLPPGPICNPGMDSINAALYPEKTDDMFFVVKSSGAHSFSRYLGEHLKNKAAYRKSLHTGAPFK
jgi:UPF0755 protein